MKNVSKNVSKRVAAWLLAATMCLSMAACGNKKGNDDKKPTPTPTASNSAGSTDESTGNVSADGEDRFANAPEFTVSIAQWSFNSDAENKPGDTIRENIEKKFKLKFKFFPISWDDYRQKAQVWAASNSLPDITASDAMGTELGDAWIKDGIVEPIPKDLSKYPNLEAALSFEDADRWKRDGQFWAIPRPNYKSPDVGILDPGAMIRKDWMKKVGVETVPTNTDDFIALLKKFVTDDPDGNNKNDTVGITAYDLGWLTGSLNISTDPGSLNGYHWVYDPDNLNKWTMSFMTEDFVVAMKNLKKYFDAGVVDPDIATFKEEAGRDRFKNNIAGAYAHSNDAYGFSDMEKAFSKSQPDVPLTDILANIMPFKNEKDGKYYYQKASLYWAESWIKGGTSPEKMDRILALLDYLISSQGYFDTAFGIEDVDFTRDGNGVIVQNEKLYDMDGKEIDKLSAKYPFTSIAGITCWSSYRVDDNPTIKPLVRELYAERLDWAKANGAVAFEMPHDKVGILNYPSKSRDTASGNFKRDVLNLMKVSDVEAAVKKLQDDYMKQGYDKIIKEVNEAAEEAGYKK